MGAVRVGMPIRSEIVLLVSIQVRAHQVHLQRSALFDVRLGTVQVQLWAGLVVVVRRDWGDVRHAGKDCHSGEGQH